MEITLCMIVKNEEKKLRACLESFHDLCSKIVIIDTGSTDATKTIAASFGAEVFDFSWADDFSTARNFALEKVTTDWTMMVDADDVLDELAREELRKHLQKISPNTLGIFLPYVYSPGLGSEAVSAYLPRIWKTNTGFRYVLPVHEYLDIQPGLLEQFEVWNIPIVHAKNEEDFSVSNKRNIAMLENAFAHGDRHPRTLFYLGVEHFQAAHLLESARWLQLFLQTSNAHHHEIYFANMLLARIFERQFRADDVKKHCLLAIKACADFPDPYVILGEMALDEKDYAAAEKYFQDALDCHPPRTHIFVRKLNREFAESQLKLARQALEKT